ncbi:MAG: hypothetical protein HY747_05555 [Elusimicrobia bacterium]|nr:hypothetical protein [Elusimicrobiota bacterium]
MFSNKLIFIFIFAAWQVQAGPQQNSQDIGLTATPDNALGEFIIKSEGNMILESEKPALALSLDETPVIRSALETEKEVYLVALPSATWLKNTMPGRLHCQYVIAPRYFQFQPDVIAHQFRLRAELEKAYQEKNTKTARRKAGWRFQIADNKGRKYMEFSGKGLPPEILAVPTTNDRAEAVRPGCLYSGILTYRDTAGKIHTAMAGEFMVNGLVKKTRKGHILRLSLNSLFVPARPAQAGRGQAANLAVPAAQETPQTVFTENGQAMIQELADWIKANRGALAPVDAVVFAKNVTQAQEMSGLFTAKLNELLIRPEEKTQIKVVYSEDHSDGYAEISIFLPR